jgi:hypothetical protein
MSERIPLKSLTLYTSKGKVEHVDVDDFCIDGDYVCVQKGGKAWLYNNRNVSNLVFEIADEVEA